MGLIASKKGANGSMQEAIERIRKEHRILWDLPRTRFEHLLIGCLRQLIEAGRIKYHKPGSGIDY